MVSFGIVGFVTPDWAWRNLPRVLTDTVAEATGRSARPDPVLRGTGGPAGNARLTAWTGLVLLALSLAELVTLLDVTGLISWHIVIGVLLVPPALLKTSTTGWRMLRYYLGSPAYAAAGPPPLLLRVLGPAVIVSTLGLLGSGLTLVALGANESRRTLLDALGVRLSWVTMHQIAFVVWAVATGLHVLGRFVPALRLTVSDQSAVPGAWRRMLIVLASLTVAVMASVLVLSAAGSWQIDRPFDRGF